MNKERFLKQMNFCLEMDKAKNIFRQTYLADGKRKENDAEHSWHIAIMAFVLAEYFDDNIDICKVMKMLLLHDVVEIDAGDTFCYDEVGYLDKEERETKAAKRIYGLLPKDQCEEFTKLWEEFEEGKTSEANLAVILDRLQPLMLNEAANGIAWIEKHTTVEQVYARNEKALKEPIEIRNYILDMVENAVKKGHLI